jgi:hypothetical protein
MHEIEAFEDLFVVGAVEDEPVGPWEIDAVAE